jgi:sulfite reductase beta subunit-like hemoprotein
MGRGLRHPGGLDPDQAAALHHLVAAFGAEQVTITTVQASQLAGQARTPTTTPAQASLLEEAS